MKKTYNEYLELIKSEKEILLAYLKAKFPLFNNSNIFYRDIQFGIRSFLEMKNYKVTYKQSEDLANEFAQMLVNDSVLERVNEQAWKVKKPEFAATAPGDPF